MSILKQLIIMCIIGVTLLICLIWAAPIQAETVTVEVDVSCTKQEQPVVVYPQPIFIGPTVERMIWEQKLKEAELQIQVLNEHIRQWRKYNE